MKKLLYIASLFLLVFTACEPMEDVYKEIDEANAQKIADEKYFAARTVLDTVYALVDDDYALSTNEDLKKYKSFSSKVTAKDNLAQILDAKMVYGEMAVDYKVSYKFYRGSLAYIKAYLKYLDEVAQLTAYELTKEDYDSMGEEKGQPGKYDNFSDKVPAADYLPDFLKTKFPDAKADDIVVVTYKFYDGKGVTNITENWQFDGTVWAENPDAGPKAPELPTDVKIYEMVKADYNSMGFKYPNFSDSNKANDYLPTFLKIKFPYAKEGAKYLVVYDFYGKKKKDDEKKSTFKQATEYTLTDGVWKPYAKVTMQTSVMNYNIEEKMWIYVIPTKFVFTDEASTQNITLTDKDYELTGDGKYKNFYLKNMSESQVNATVLEKLTKILKVNYSDIELNTVVEVTFRTYGLPNKKEMTVKLKKVLAE